MKRVNKFFSCALDVFQGSTLSSSCFKWQIPMVDLIIADKNSSNQQILACLSEAYQKNYHCVPKICRENFGLLRKYDKRIGFYLPLITKLMEEKLAARAIVVADAEVIKQLSLRGSFSYHNGIWFCPQKLEDVPIIDHLPGTITYDIVKYQYLVLDAADINNIPLGIALYINAMRQQKTIPQVVLLGNYRNPYQNTKARMLLNTLNIEYSEDVETISDNALLVTSPQTCCISQEMLVKQSGVNQLWCYINDVKLGDLWKAPYVSKKILLQNLQDNVDAYIRMYGDSYFSQDYHKKKLELFRQNAPQFRDNFFQRIRWQMSLRVYASYLRTSLPVLD